VQSVIGAVQNFVGVGNSEHAEQKSQMDDGLPHQDFDIVIRGIDKGLQ
jgi:hypothetical protein